MALPATLVTLCCKSTLGTSHRGDMYVQQDISLHRRLTLWPEEAPWRGAMPIAAGCVRSGRGWQRRLDAVADFGGHLDESASACSQHSVGAKVSD